jgi:hypothetical protein
MINRFGAMSASDVTWNMTFVQGSAVPGWVGPGFSAGWTGPSGGGQYGASWFLTTDCRLFNDNPNFASFNGVGVADQVYGCLNAGPFCSMLFPCANVSILVANPANGVCQRDPDWLSLGNAHPPSDGVAYLECQVSPVTVTLSSSNCPCLNGTTFPIQLSNFSNEFASWQSAPLTLCGRSMVFTLQYVPQNALASQEQWLATLAEPAIVGGIQGLQGPGFSIQGQVPVPYFFTLTPLAIAPGDQITCNGAAANITATLSH